MLIALAWTTCILPAHSAELEFSLLASSDNFTLGSEFAVITDWLLGSRGLTSGPSGPLGGFRIVSGTDGTLLLEESADQVGTGLGQSLRALPGFGFAVGEPSLADPVTGGRGAAHFWSVDTIIDTDGDGVPDSEDAVIESNLETTLTILGFDTGVENRLEPDGTTLSDRFDALPHPDELSRRSLYLRYSTRLVVELLRNELISRRESRAILRTSFRALLQTRR